jgi:hypothetical protein
LILEQFNMDDAIQQFNLVPLRIRLAARNCVKSPNSPQNASQKAAPEAGFDLAPPI